MQHFLTAPMSVLITHSVFPEDWQEIILQTVWSYSVVLAKVAAMKYQESLLGAEKNLEETVSKFK